MADEKDVALIISRQDVFDLADYARLASIARSQPRTLIWGLAKN